MRITRIEIEKYKSIKEPIEINFYDDLPTVLIGKNGSGKTNILEALYAITNANSTYFGLSKNLPLNYKVHIRLSKDDIVRLFPGKKIDENKCQFVACSGENCKIDRIESEYLVPLLNSEICEIHNLANELKNALDTYKKQLGKIACNERNELPPYGFEITDFENSTTNYDTLNFQVKSLIQEAEKFADSLMQRFESKENSFRFGYVYYGYNYFSSNDARKWSFQLRYIEPDLAPFEAKFITVNRTAIKREITKINKATKASCEKITALLKKLAECVTRLKEALTGEQLGQYGDDTFYQFIREMQKCVGNKCSFLRNESSNIIFRNNETEQEYYRNDKSFVVLQTYLNKVYNGADKEDLLKQIQSKETFSLTDAALSEFEKYLNSDIPEFDTGMYDHISVERSEGKIPTIVLHEKSGDTVALNSTSAGRRWYFTYYFMKNTLHSGDLFIIDEPAAMLHPIAQKEVMRELLTLEKNGIKVVYSTHSPYLIPSDWESVHFITMENSGTAVTTVETQGEYCGLMKQITDSDIFNLQELVDKYKKCGNVKAANNCYKALMKKYGSMEVASENVHFSPATIESWKKKKRGTSFENVISIAATIGISPEELL